jgi:hypothetical protein
MATEAEVEVILDDAIAFFEKKGMRVRGGNYLSSVVGQGPPPRPVEERILFTSRSPSRLAIAKVAQKSAENSCVL